MLNLAKSKFWQNLQNVGFFQIQSHIIVIPMGPLLHWLQLPDFSVSWGTICWLNKRVLPTEAGCWWTWWFVPPATARNSPSLRKQVWQGKKSQCNCAITGFEKHHYSKTLFFLCKQHNIIIAMRKWLAECSNTLLNRPANNNALRASHFANNAISYM